MFRRIRRNIAGALTSAQLQTLSQANQFYSQGHPQQAAGLFSLLGRELLANNHPRRAANLFAQAAHAYADSRTADQALIYSRQALDLFIQYQMLDRASHFYTNILAKLRQQEMGPSASLLEQTYGQRIRELSPAEMMNGQNPPKPTSRGRLPASCPKCGAPVSPVDVSWLDNETAECNYCGATLQTDPKGL